MPSDSGLCGGCVHQRVVRNTRGSSFSLCERSRTDPSYRRYPPLPVLECRGFEPKRQERDTGDGGGSGEE